MSAKDSKKTETPWRQRSFDLFKATRSFARRKKDRLCLQEAFNQAADVPVLKEVLAWAETHGIKYFIDRTCVNVGGYYWPGTGVVAIAERHTHSLHDFVRTIVHETRHAWQDYHGLIKNQTYNFAEYFIKTALIEADAYAFERRAVIEFEIAQQKKLGNPGAAIAEAALADKEGYFRARFLEWFSTDRTKFYGDALSKHYGRIFGLYSGVMPERHCEIKSTVCTLPLGTGIDITDSQSILKLGRTFSGGNYLAKLPREVLLKKILSPTLAMSFYGAANDEQKKLVADIRKRYLQERRNYDFWHPRKPFPFKK